MIVDLALDDKVFITNTIDAAVQELDMLFSTTNTELIGNVDYGTNFEQFLWQLTPSEESIKKYIYEKIGQTFFLSKMKVDVKIQSTYGAYRDIYEVTVDITPPSESLASEAYHRRRVYQFR